MSDEILSTQKTFILIYVIAYICFCWKELYKWREKDTLPEPVAHKVQSKIAIVAG